MEKFLFFFHGYVVLSVHGSQLERFLNLCRNRGIFIRHLTCLQNGELRFVLSLADFWKLPGFLQKPAYIFISSKNAACLSFLTAIKKERLFLRGFFFCLLLLFLCSTRIWNIHIEGNIAYSTPEILGFLKEEDVVHGMAKREVHCPKPCSQSAGTVSQNHLGFRPHRRHTADPHCSGGKRADPGRKIETSPCNLFRQPGRYDCKDHHQKRRSPGEAGRCVQARGYSGARRWKFKMTAKKSCVIDMCGQMRTFTFVMTLPIIMNFH